MTPGLVLILSGTLRLLIATCVLLRQTLGRPDRPNYPTAPAAERAMLFGLALFLVYNGSELITRGAARPDHAFVSGLPLSLAWFAAEGMATARVLRSWLPARLQRRVAALLRLASCEHRDAKATARARETAMKALWPGVRVPPPPPPSVLGPALADLHLAGWTAVAPNEPPSALER